MSRNALIIGVTGQDGAYLARHLLTLGYAVHGTSRDAEAHDKSNLRRLGLLDRLRLHSVAPTDFRSVMQCIGSVRPDEIYNLSGQSSVGLSFDQPGETMESIANGTLNVLEAVRLSGLPARIYNACSGECFGDVGGEAADEATAFRPLSPYATAKAAAFWLLANYRQAYGLHASSGILFNHESPLRPERFVTRKIVAAAVRIANGSTERLKLGNTAIRRDWGWAPDYVEAMHLMLQQQRPRDFVIATGEAHSLGEFVAAVFATVGLEWRKHVVIDQTLFRRAEIMANVGNAGAARATLGWEAKVILPELAERLVAAERDWQAAK